MAEARLAKQLTVETKNKIGMFAEVSSAVADAGVNVIALCAYGMEKKAYFYLLTSDNAKAKKALSQKKYAIEEQEVVTVMLEDKVGQAKEIAQKIKAAGVDLEYVYGSNCGCQDTQALLVIQSKDNAKVMSAING